MEVLRCVLVNTSVPFNALEWKKQQYGLIWNHFREIWVYDEKVSRMQCDKYEKTLQFVVQWECDRFLFVVKNVMECINMIGDRGEQSGRNQVYSRGVVYSVNTVSSVTIFYFIVYVYRPYLGKRCGKKPLGNGRGWSRDLFLGYEFPD